MITNNTGVSLVIHEATMVRRGGIIAGQLVNQSAPILSPSANGQCRFSVPGPPQSALAGGQLEAYESAALFGGFQIAIGQHGNYTIPLYTLEGREWGKR